MGGHDARRTEELSTLQAKRTFLRGQGSRPQRMGDQRSDQRKPKTAIISLSDKLPKPSLEEQIDGTRKFSANSIAWV